MLVNIGLYNDTEPLPTYNHLHFKGLGHKILFKLEQLEHLRSEDTPCRPMITHTIDQFILNPKTILLTSSYQIPSQNKVKGKKL